MQPSHFVHLIKILFIVGVLMSIAIADPETASVWPYCGKTQYRNGSVFQSNLNNVLESLVQYVYSIGFNTSVHGPSGDAVYGLIQCRGDLDSSDCKACASTAKTKLLQDCHNSSGLIQLDGCFIRYENYNFFSDIESRQNSNIQVLCNTGNSTDRNQFTSAVKSLLSNVTSRAAENPKLFTADSVSAASSITSNIYSIAQCWRDLSSTSCEACLTFAYTNIFRCQVGALGAQVGTKNCYLRYEVYAFFNTSILSSNSSRPVMNNSSGSNGSKLPIILSLVAVTLLICGVIGIWKRKSLSSLLLKQNPPNRGLEGVDVSLTISCNPKLNCKYDTLRDATANFQPENKLGEGGFGSVHKGVLPDGRVVAIKRLYMGSRQGDTEFLNEINLISRVKHTNLVKLLGCCIENSERLLVYEYLHNRSLDKILFEPTKCHLLDWKKRLEIIVGTARGLAYLHEESEIRIIHRDIKASNILLDDKHRPKITDFGLARLFADDQSHVSTRVAGTLGYMAPEYALGGQLTEKADVFSFGVLALEIISGRKNQNLTRDMQFLLEGTWRLYESDSLSEIIDPTLEGSYPLEEAMRVIHIALLCTQAAAALRPSMSRVVLMLTSEQEHLPLPTTPAFIDLDNVQPKLQRDITPVRSTAKSSSDAATSSSISASFSATPSNTFSVADPSSRFLEPR